MTQEGLWEAIEQEKEELLSLCSALISIPSINPPGDMEGITRYLCRYLDEANIPYQVVGGSEKWPNIVAQIGNPQGKTILFNGHSDVVPVGEESRWDFPPFSGEMRDGVMLGRGTSDMKCGLGAFLFVTALVKRLHIPLKGQVRLTIVPDEETGGAFGTKWLAEHGYLVGDWGIVAEPTGMDNIEVGQKGTLGLNIHASGTTAHGSLSPYVGDNAIDKLLKVLPALYDLRTMCGTYEGERAQVMEVSRQKAKRVQRTEGVEDILNHVTVNIGTIQGGVKRNMVPDQAMAEVDVRVPIGVNHEDVMARVQHILDGSGLSGVWATYDNPKSGNDVSISNPVVSLTVDVIRQLTGVQAVPAYQWASSDTAYLRGLGIPTIQFGPSNTEGIHNYNETVQVADIITAAKVYGGLILSLVGPHAP